MAGDAGSSSSGSTNFCGGDMHAQEMPGLATGDRGITKGPFSLFTTIPEEDGEGNFYVKEVHVDCFPEDDQWMPPLHGDDVESFSDISMKELDEQRHNYAEFMRILEAHGCQCSSLEEDFLPCFKDEEGLHDPAKGRGNCHRTEEQRAPQETESGSSMERILSKSFFYGMKQGHLVRPSTEELERCLNALPEHLPGNLFKSLHKEAVGAEKNLDWEMACDQYTACLVLLENMENSISIHIQTWLLLWVCIPLAYLYQIRLRNYPKCIKIYDQMLQQLNETDDPDLDKLYYSVVWQCRMVLFEWSYTFEKAGNQLLAQYVRSRAFNEVRGVQFPGFVQLQRMINYWGRRTQRGLEGDMRVALCSNLEHLYRDCKQRSEAVNWTREKWRWIHRNDLSHELNAQWRFDDVLDLFNAGMTEEAQRMIAALEEEKNPSPRVSLKIRFWKAKFLRKSNPKEANNQLQILKSDVEKKVGPDLDKELLVLVKLEISTLNYQDLPNATILELAPVGLEPGKQRDDASDTTAADFLNDVRHSSLTLDSSELGNYKLHLIQGGQLLVSLAKYFKAEEIESYRDRVNEAVEHFQTAINLMPQIRNTVLHGSDEVIDRDKVVETLQSISTDEILAHLSIGMCYVYLHELKPDGVKYNEDRQKEMKPVMLADIRLNTAVMHLQKSLELAKTNCHVSLERKANTIFGWVHFSRAKLWYEKVKDFRTLIPVFKSNFTEQNGNNKPVVQLFAQKMCRNPYHVHWYCLALLENEIICNYLQYFDFPDLSSSSSLSPSLTSPERVGVIHLPRPWRGPGVVEQCLTDELLEKALRLCLGGLLHHTLMEIRKSTNYTKRSVEMLNETPFDTSEEQNQLVPHLNMVEKTKKLFTSLQHLTVWEQDMKDMVKHDMMLQNLFSAIPVIAEFLHSEPRDLAQKALLWAERGRSRSLMQQLLAYKPLDKLTHKMVNFNMMDDQESWKSLRNSRLSCGKNAVFVEYTFDETHEYISDVINFERSVRWIVYVVTKEDEVHMRSYETKIPHTTVKALHKNLSKRNENGIESMNVKRALEELYDVFIRPISDLLGSMDPEDKLVFAVDEVLTNVPFSILRNSQAPETKKYLFQNHTISFTPSLRILEHCYQRLKSLQASNTVAPSVALGDPAYINEFGRLKRSYFEVRNISLLFNTNYVKVLTGTEATVDNILRLANLPTDTVQGFVHVAAHGLVEKGHESGSLRLAHPSVQHQDQPPELSSQPNSSTQRTDKAIELEELTSDLTNDFATLDLDELGRVQRGGKDPAKEAKEREERKARQKDRQKAKGAESAKEAEERSFLRCQRIMQCGFEWRSYMVVLSACNSAKGYVLGSEGVVGLPHAFLVAGVPCIVASQWELPDEASSDLMQEFYMEMSLGYCRDASSALRAAMLRMMKPKDGSSEVDVYKWGGFLVWGLPTVTLPPSMMKKMDDSELTE